MLNKNSRHHFPVFVYLPSSPKDKRENSMCKKLVKKLFSVLSKRSIMMIKIGLSILTALLIFSVLHLIISLVPKEFKVIVLQVVMISTVVGSFLVTFGMTLWFFSKRIK
jgi:hypothetical protein